MMIHKIIPLVSKLQEDGMWDATGFSWDDRSHASLMYSSAPNLSGSALQRLRSTGIHWDRPWDPVPERVEAKVSNHVRTSGVIPGGDMLWQKESYYIYIYIILYISIYIYINWNGQCTYTSQNWQLLVDGPTLTMHVIFSNVRKIMSADPWLRWLFGSWDVQAQASKEAQLTSSPGVG